ncbi:unnamed protein product [Blepharisma stoltei]|uniref:Uncharacterized protein n=1 Tax=Blepharisma stoltei TaxID=1481888 RepID=A0AAU9JUH6_9CILI|nr:unnamed protein product [Blepharisma stoltei]
MKIRRLRYSGNEYKFCILNQKDRDHLISKFEDLKRRVPEFLAFGSLKIKFPELVTISFKYDSYFPQSIADILKNVFKSEPKESSNNLREKAIYIIKILCKSQPLKDIFTINHNEWDDILVPPELSNFTQEYQLDTRIFEEINWDFIEKTDEHNFSQREFDFKLLSTNLIDDSSLFDIKGIDIEQVEMPIIENCQKYDILNKKFNKVEWDSSCFEVENSEKRLQNVWDIGMLLAPKPFIIEIDDIRLKKKTHKMPIFEAKAHELPKFINNFDSKPVEKIKTTAEENKFVNKTRELPKKSEIPKDYTLETVKVDYEAINHLLTQEKQNNIEKLSHSNYLNTPIKIPSHLPEPSPDQNKPFTIHSQFHAFTSDPVIPETLLFGEKETPQDPQIPSFYESQPQSKQVRFSSQFLNFEYSQSNPMTQIHLLPFKIFTNSSSDLSLSLILKMKAPENFYFVSLETDSKFMHCMDLIVTWQTGIKICGIDILYSDALTSELCRNLSEIINRFDTILLFFYGERKQEMLGLCRMIAFCSLCEKLGCTLHIEIAESFGETEEIIEMFIEQYIKLINSKDHWLQTQEYLIDDMNDISSLIIECEEFNIYSAQLLSGLYQAKNLSFSLLLRFPPQLLQLFKSLGVPSSKCQKLKELINAKFNQ